MFSSFYVTYLARGYIMSVLKLVIFQNVHYNSTVPTSVIQDFSVWKTDKDSDCVTSHRSESMDVNYIIQKNSSTFNPLRCL